MAVTRVENPKINGAAPKGERVNASDASRTSRKTQIKLRQAMITSLVRRVPMRRSILPPVRLWCGNTQEPAERRGERAGTRQLFGPFAHDLSEQKRLGSGEDDGFPHGLAAHQDVLLTALL